MLVHCTECGKEVSDRAKACPHCGAPLSEGGNADISPVKKRLAFVLAVFFGFLGVHNFYLKRAIRGCLQLAILVMTLFVFSTNEIMITHVVIALELCAIVESLCYKVDGKGKLLQW
jgi:TM2 domain-containing membrane protein YozV